MAFDNTVPYTIDGTIDTNTNLIAFVVSEYDLNRATGLYDLLQWTESFSLPAGDVGYKRTTDQVFILQSAARDQFSIYQGWYDVQADLTYNTIGTDLDDMVDALVAQNTGGGSLGYTEYVASIRQADTDAPVATIINNTLGGVPVWSYVTVGTYDLTLTGVFDTGKTSASASIGSDDNSIAYHAIFNYEGIPNAVTLKVFNANGTTPQDVWGTANGESTITIKVYS